MQVVPFCKEEWQSQVGSGLVAYDAELDEKDKWGSYPRLREIKKAHKAMFDDIQGEFCQLELQRDGPTDAQTLACMQSLLQGNSMDWKFAAYLCVVRGTADRGATTLYRRLMDSELEVRAVSRWMVPCACICTSGSCIARGALASICTAGRCTSKGMSCQSQSILVPICPLRVGRPAMQLVETMEEGPAQPQRSPLFKMFLLRDKGGQHKRRPSCVTRHLDVCWDPISATGRVLMSSFAPPYGVASLLGEDLFKVVLFSDSSDRTLTLSSDTLRKTVKKHQRMAGYCPPKLSTADGKPPQIKKLGLVLHGMRTKGGRRLANRLQGGWQELNMYYNHENPA